MALVVEAYEPHLHEPYLQHWAELLERPFHPDAMSGHGYVVLNADGPLLCIFAYRDPTSRTAFVDNLQANPEAPLFARLGALRYMLRVVQYHLQLEGVRIIRFTTANRAIRSIFERAGIVPLCEEASSFVMRIGE
jgi:hypothetical protein